jgi:hypothetical protein
VDGGGVRGGVAICGIGRRGVVAISGSDKRVCGHKWTWQERVRSSYQEGTWKEKHTRRKRD